MAAYPYILHDTEEGIRAALATLPRRGRLFVDTETTGTDPLRGKLVLVQILPDGDENAAILLDWRRAFPRWGEDLLVPALVGRTLIAHNAKFDLRWLLANGCNADATWYCTQVAEQVARGVGLEDAGVRGVPLSLAGLAAAYNVPTPVSKVERSWFYEPAPLDERPEWDAPIPDDICSYGAQDVVVLREVFHRQRAAMPRSLWPVVTLEMRVLPALAALEHHGVYVEQQSWREVISEQEAVAAEAGNDLLAEVGSAILAQRIQTYDAEMAVYLAAKEKLDFFAGDARFHYETATPDDPYPVREGETYGQWKRRVVAEFKQQCPVPPLPTLDTSPPNLGSSKQLLEGLNACGIGVESTDAKTLARLEGDSTLLTNLRRYRKAAKLVSAFGDKLLERINPDDGLIHYEVVQVGASTGRMSCRNPNWQQIPSRGDVGKRLRAAVKARPGYKLVFADFSNIELRILAEYSGDERLLDFFARDVDLHADVAKLMFGVEDARAQCPAIAGWTYRDVAKTINYGLVYGMSAARLGKTMKVSDGIASSLMDRYFSLFPGVTEWLDHTAAHVLHAGSNDYLVSRTKLGRFRSYDTPGTRGERARVERQACNTPIQGTSADITKLAVALWHEMPTEQKGALVAVVHDELGVEARDADAETAAALLERAMDDAQHTWLHTVTLAYPQATISDHWEH